MHLLTLTALGLLLSVQSPEEPPAPAQPAPEATAAPEPQPAPTELPPQAQHPAQPAPQQQVATGQAVRRASSVPLTRPQSGRTVRRVVGGLLTGTGVFLTGLGLGAVGLTALVHYSEWPRQPEADQYPRQTVSVLTAAVAAVTLMVGFVCVLGGLAGVIA